MSFSIGICGLPNVGKSTLFKILTKREVKISPIPFSTIQPNVGVVSVPDEILDKIAEIVKPEKKTYPKIEFIDVAGLIKGAHKGEGLGNQFLAHLKNCDGILQVIRGFESLEVENLLGEINPKEEIEIIKLEFLMKDLETVERAIEKASREKKNLLERLKNFLREGKEIREENFKKEELKEIKDLQLLSLKPKVYLINGPEKDYGLKEKFLNLDLKEEEELLKLSEEKKEIGKGLGVEKVIKECFKALRLIRFYTIVGGKEVKAYTLREKEDIEKAAKKVHSDFVKFIRAEVLPARDFLEIGSWREAKKIGKIKVVGKDYEVKEGDIIEFKI